MRWKRYHFSVGNSNTGPVGYCASVFARSEAEAVEILKKTLCETYECEDHHTDTPSIDYVNFYTNTDHVSEKDIDDSEDVDEETQKRLEEAHKNREAKSEG